jgi:hypothetical protein
MADPTVLEAGRDDASSYSSMIGTSPIGILNKASTAKRSLIGGA